MPTQIPGSRQGSAPAHPSPYVDTDFPDRAGSAFLSWRVIGNMLGHCLIDLLRSEKFNCLHPSRARARDSERNGRSCQIIRYIKDEIGVIFAESEVKRFESSTQTLQKFLNDSTPCRPTDLIESLDSLRGIGSHRQILGHKSGPKEGKVYNSPIVRRSSKLWLLTSNNS